VDDLLLPVLWGAGRVVQFDSGDAGPGGSGGVSGGNQFGGVVSREYVAAVLVKAADYIESHGWVQNIYRSGGPGGCVCMVGAIDAVIRDPVRVGVIGKPFENECVEVVAEYLRLDAEMSVEDWNDAEGRSVDEVTRVLRDAAEWERGK
jgi:hypothetical protein